MDIILTKNLRNPMKLCLALMLMLFPLSISSYDVVIRTPDGEINSISVSEDQSVVEFMESMHYLFGDSCYCIVDVVGANYNDFIRKAGLQRNYAVPLTASQKKDIAYIVNTLGMASLVKIAKERSSLKKAGDRLELIHPFHFVGAIFTDEEMKSSIHALKSRGWVWSDFFEGINSSMTEESKNNNILPFMHDFAARVGIDVNLIAPSLEAGNWKEFVNVLLDKVPRNKNNNRYQM